MAKIIIFGDITICPLYISVDEAKEMMIHGKKPRYINLRPGTHYITVTTITKFQRAMSTLSTLGDNILSKIGNSCVSCSNTSLAGEIDFGQNDVLMLQSKQLLTKSVINQRMMDISQAGKYVDMNAMVEATRWPPWMKWAVLSMCLLLGIYGAGSSLFNRKTTYGNLSAETVDNRINSSSPSTWQYSSAASSPQDADHFAGAYADGYQEPEDYTVRESHTFDIGTAAEDAAEYILPDSDSIYLTRSDLEGLTKEECRLARNEIYARRGRKFNDAALADYFSQFGWYHPTVDPENFDDSMLNAVEKANRDLIVQFEKERGYR